MSAIYFLVLLVVVINVIHTSAFASSRRSTALRMALDPVLTKSFPRDFKNIPLGTDYGKGQDEVLNKKVEERRLKYLEDDLFAVLKDAVTTRQRPMFTTALIAGDNVILDAIAKLGLLSKVPIVFVDTFTLFPESIAHIRELENHYGFKAKTYHAADCADVNDYHAKYGRDYWMKDIDKYDLLCKVEPMNRALKEQNSDCWINGRRRDHGAERAALPVWEGAKLNPLAFWTFEDCWSYLRKNNVPYHPLHDVGFSSLGDVHSTKKVDPKIWFTYGGERSGRFQNLVNKDGSAKTECGIHTEINAKDLSLKA
jgi:phosphoadenosine phosphosulfate reductase